MNVKLPLYLGLAGLLGGFGYGIKEGINYTSLPSYNVKTKLEAKVDSLQDKRNYWIALKDSSKLTTLAEGFINNYDEQIKNYQDSIFKIEANPEFKRLKRKATSALHSDGVKIIMGSLLFGMFLNTSSLIKDKRRKKQEELEEEN
jgi:hypothetical protein